MTARFIGELDVRHLKEPVDKTKWFKTIAPISYVSESGSRYNIPVGTATDFASIPPPLRWLISRFGRHSPAALLHDWLCKYHIVSRKEADRLLLEASRALSVKRWRRGLLYFGVRVYSIVTMRK